MRLFLAALVISGGIGYAYFHQVSLAATKAEPARPRLFNWQSAEDPLVAAISEEPSVAEYEPPQVVRDTVNTARHEVRSVLDEFVRTNGESTPVPVPSQPDIVAHRHVSTSNTAHETEPTVTADSELIPFASSDDDVVSDAANELPADASAVTIQATSQASTTLEPTSPAESAPAETKPAKPTASELPKPKINEATLVNPQPGQTTIPIQPITQPEVAKSATPQTKAHAAPRSKAELPSAKPSTNAVVDDSNWKVIGKTVNQSPMHSRRFGRQGIRTLVIAGLDGKDLVATHWNDQLVALLPRQADLFQSNEVMIVRAGNPDGLMKKTSANAHGVLINRNFPSRRYQFLTDKSAGPGPASEVETHAILDTLYSFRPRRVIHLASTAGRSTVSYNRAARLIAMDLQKQYQWEAQPLDVELAPGSIEDFADGTLDAAVISLKLNVKSGAEWQQAWTKHQPALLAILDGQDKMQPVSDELTQASPDQSGTRIPVEEEESTTIPKHRRGYEELPRPPR